MEKRLSCLSLFQLVSTWKAAPLFMMGWKGDTSWSFMMWNDGKRMLQTVLNEFAQERDSFICFWYVHANPSGKPCFMMRLHQFSKRGILIGIRQI